MSVLCCLTHLKAMLKMLFLKAAKNWLKLVKAFKLHMIHKL